MATCQKCSDTKKCVTCNGHGKLLCSCQDGNCSSCNGSGKVMSDGSRITCYSCNGGGKCKKCNGSSHVICSECKGDGYCIDCIEYRRKWKEASDLAKSGDVFNATQILHKLLQDIDQKKSFNMTADRTAGAAGGAIIGSFLLPGLGTIIGGALGGFFGNNMKTGIKSMSSLAAETHYRLGVIYEMIKSPECLQHYMQAKSLDSNHYEAEEAMRRLKPDVPISSQLANLDDDF